MTVAVDINAMLPTPEQRKAFVALPEEPVVMVNLLKFKPNGGEEEYAKYISGLEPVFQRIGARVLFSGKAATCFIGNGDWDQALLVEYPNPNVLLEMARSEDYQALVHHREAGLSGQVCYAVTQKSLSQ